MLKIDRSAFLALALGMNLGACGGSATPAPANPGSGPTTKATPGPTSESMAMAPHNECIGWDPKGECTKWAPTEECVAFDPKGECTKWEPRKE
jgi:hypothetical protein